MSIDRKTLLLQHANATAALKNPNLPDRVRALAKKARDLTAVSLGLQDAVARKAEREIAPSPASPGATSPVTPAPQPVPASSSAPSAPMSEANWLRGRLLALRSIGQMTLAKDMPNPAASQASRPEHDAGDTAVHRKCPD